MYNEYIITHFLHPLEKPARAETVTHHEQCTPEWHEKCTAGTPSSASTENKITPLVPGARPCTSG